MTALLYYSISSNLTENEIIGIDLYVTRNRKFLRDLPSYLKRKAKIVFLYATFIHQLGQPLVSYAAAVEMPLTPATHRLSPIQQDRILRNKNGYPQVAIIPELKGDKIRLTNEQKQIKQFNNLALQLNSDSLTIEEVVLGLRGNDGLTDVFSVIAFVIFINWYDSLFSVEAFKANPLLHQDPFGWLNGKYNSKNVGPSGSRPTTYLQMEKPPSMPQQEYSGMTPSERRQFPDAIGKDRSINVDGYPRLDLRFNRVEFKTPKHGKDHGLPVGSNGKTLKIEYITLGDSLVNMPNREKIVWYTDGQYQGGTDRGCDCVNLFDPDTNVIAVYEKQPDGSNLFLTTCTLTERESDHLKSTNGNFVTEKILDQQNWVNEGIGITPISPMDENSSPGFSPTSSFESDVIGITPIDNSQSNNP